MTGLRNRVIEMRIICAEELQDNEGNWRYHPQFQRDSLRGVLETVGIADALKAYYSERQGGLTLVDGHLRKEDYPGEGWPVLILDVGDAEAGGVKVCGQESATLGSPTRQRRQT